MKVTAFNGSPRKNGNTARALGIVAGELEQDGIECEIVHVGHHSVRGCMNCLGCAKKADKRCVLTGDPVNEWIAKMCESDGIVFGSPVYFAGMGSTMKGFLDRAFFVSAVNGNLCRHKIGASLAAVRRTGGQFAFHEMNNYLLFSEMTVASSNYWNVIHGHKPDESEADEEGKQIMKVLGKNIAWLLRLRESGEKNGVRPPEQERKILTNFIR